MTPLTVDVKFPFFDFCFAFSSLIATLPCLPEIKQITTPDSQNYLTMPIKYQGKLYYNHFSLC